MVDEDDGDAEVIKLVNQYMTSLAPEFEVVSVDHRYGCNDWADNYRHSSLLVDELEVGKRFKDKSESVNAIKR